MASKTIFHPYGLKAEVDIEPRVVALGSTATQTVRIHVEKTCESMGGWCHASAVNGWVTFDDESIWSHFVDLDERTSSRWRKRTLAPVKCLIARVGGVKIPPSEPETVTVKLEVRDNLGKQIFSEPGAIIKVVVQ